MLEPRYRPLLMPTFHPTSKTHFFLTFVLRSIQGKRVCCPGVVTVRLGDSEARHRPALTFCMALPEESGGACCTKRLGTSAPCTENQTTKQLVVSITRRRRNRQR